MEERRLAAIMFTDIAGYTLMMQADEVEGKKKAKHYRKVLSEQVKAYQGNVIQNYGDGSLTIFNSAVKAAECAIKLQSLFQKEPVIPLRIGIHLGDIVVDGEDIYGDGINVAARIESMGVEGGILVSENVCNQIKNHSSFKLQSLGQFDFKNVQNLIEVFAIINEGLAIPDPKELQGKFKTDREIEKSIAILPFVNMSNDPDQEFFSDGISEEIINTVVQLPDLRVAGRTSSFSFKGKNEDLRVIGEKLGVKNILEGSVRKFANKVRVTAQLIEASTGFHLWSRKYDRELEDVFKIQDEISLEIADQLKITFASANAMPKPRQQTQNIEAYQLYFKGRSLFYQRGMSLFEALKCFQASLKIDPNYALAASGLADTYIMLSFHGYLSPDECWAEAIPAAQKARKYGPDLGETHNTFAIIALLHDWNLEHAEKEFMMALEINPTHIQARVWYGLFFQTLAKKNFKEGIEQLNIAIETDPLSAYAHATYGMALATAGNIDECIDITEYSVKLDPKSMIAHHSLGYSYLWSGQTEKALEKLKTALDISNRHVWNLHLILLTYIKLNQRGEAFKIFQEMEARYRDHYLPPSNLAIGAAALGKNKYALELAQTAVDIIDPYLPFIVSKLKDAEVLQEIPGFNKIQKKLGYSHLL